MAERFGSKPWWATWCVVSVLVAAAAPAQARVEGDPPAPPQGAEISPGPEDSTGGAEGELETDTPRGSHHFALLGGGQYWIALGSAFIMNLGPAVAVDYTYGERHGFFARFDFAVSVVGPVIAPSLAAGYRLYLGDDSLGFGLRVGVCVGLYVGTGAVGTGVAAPFAVAPSLELKVGHFVLQVPLESGVIINYLGPNIHLQVRLLLGFAF